jgi:tetratricopeptide (TPR) repeat protein
MRCQLFLPARTPALLLVLSASLALGVTARAQEPPSEADAKAEARAREHFELGQRAYDLRQFEVAREHWSNAYQLKPLPGFLFNLGQCERLLGRPAQAAFYYRRFLDQAPDSTSAPTARALLREMEAKVDHERREKEKAAQAAANAQRALGPGYDVGATPDGLEGQTPFYRSWWFITGATLFVTGAASATAWGISQSGPRNPSLGEVNAR